MNFQMESEAERPCFICGEPGECGHRENELRIALRRDGYIPGQLPTFAVVPAQPAKIEPQRVVVSQSVGFQTGVTREDAFRRRV